MIYSPMPAPNVRRVDDDGGHTLEEIAAVLGISRARVHQIECTALRKLRRDRSAVAAPEALAEIARNQRARRATWADEGASE